MSGLFIVKYSVYGDFGIETKVNLTNIKIKGDSKIVRLYYSFESAETYDDILRAATQNHLNLPDLASATLGSRWSGYRVDLYEKRDAKFELVGQIGDIFRGNQYRAPIFRNVEDAFYLFKRIIQSQIRYNSRLRDVILTALNMSGIADYKEIQHQWSWNAFEWFLRGLSNSTNFTPLLDYDAMIDSSSKDNLRKQFHEFMRTQILDFIKSVSDVENGFNEKWKYDQKILQKMGTNFNIKPSIMEMYDQHIDFFKELLSEYSKTVNDKTIAKELEIDSENIDSLRNLVMDAKDARDGFVHTSDFHWKRTGLSNIDGVRKFRAFASIMLLIAMTKSPELFDTETSEFDTVDLPDVIELIPPTRFPREGILKREIRGADNTIDTHSTEITIRNWDYKKRELKISPKDRISLFEAYKSSIYPFDSTMQVDCRISTSEISFAGVVDHTRLDEGIVIKVHRWCYE